MRTTRRNLMTIRGNHLGVVACIALTSSFVALQRPSVAFADQAEAQAADPQLPSKPTFATRARVVVLPVIVGGVGEPAPEFIEALAKGLRENLNWDVTVPSASTPVAALGTDGAAMEAAIAAAPPAPGASTPVNELEAAFSRLVDASMKAPLGANGTAALLRTGGALLSAHVTAGKDDDARKVASELKQLLPGRKLGEADGLSFVAAAVMTAAPPAGVPAEFKSNPAGCAIEIDGFEVGKGAVELSLRPGTIYAAQARCAAAPGGSPTESFLRVVSVQTETPAKFVLDAGFPAHLKSSSNGIALAFDSSEQRQSLEAPFVRRVAERYGATSVVLASVGEFQSAQWVNARLYLSSGYKNRHGLVRIEIARVTSLGRYLATGKESPGVLNAEEAGSMVAASRTLRPVSTAPVKPSAWYQDVPAWCLLGAGAGGLALGIWADGLAEDKRRESARSVEDPFRQDRLNTQASNLKFFGGIGTFGGVLLMGTGIVLLALPEYTDNRSGIYGFAPLPGGGRFTYQTAF